MQVRHSAMRVCLPVIMVGPGERWRGFAACFEGMKTGEISQEKSLACVHKNTHMAYRKKYKALILK